MEKKLILYFKFEFFFIFLNHFSINLKAIITNYSFNLNQIHKYNPFEFIIISEKPKFLKN